MTVPPDLATNLGPAGSRDEVLVRIRAVRGELEALGVRSVRLFGSAARDELGSESDVDVLVEFDETPSLRPFIATLELLEPAAEARDVGQQPAGLVLLHVQAGAGEQQPPVVAGLGHAGAQP